MRCHLPRRSAGTAAAWPRWPTTYRKRTRPQRRATSGIPRPAGSSPRSGRRPPRRTSRTAASRSIRRRVADRLRRLRGCGVRRRGPRPDRATPGRSSRSTTWMAAASCSSCRCPSASIVYCLAFSPDGTRLAAGDEDRNGLDLGRSDRARAARDAGGTTVASASRSAPTAGGWPGSIGTRVAGPRRRGRARDPDLAWRPIPVVDGGFNPVVAWSPDGTRLAASNWDGSITVWNGPDGDDHRPESDGRRRGAGSSPGTWTRPRPPSPQDRPAAAAFHLDELERLNRPTPTSLVRRAEIAVRLRRLDDGRQGLRPLARRRRGRGALTHYLAYARLFLICAATTRVTGSFVGRSLDSFEKGPDAQVGLAAGPDHRAGTRPGRGRRTRRPIDPEFPRRTRRPSPRICSRWPWPCTGPSSGSRLGRARRSS